jgi:hypothetical protein
VAVVIIQKRRNGVADGNKMLEVAKAQYENKPPYRYRIANNNGDQYARNQLHHAGQGNLLGQAVFYSGCEKFADIISFVNSFELEGPV